MKWVRGITKTIINSRSQVLHQQQVRLSSASYNKNVAASSPKRNVISKALSSKICTALKQRNYKEVLHWLEQQQNDDDVQANNKMVPFKNKTYDIQAVSDYLGAPSSSLLPILGNRDIYQALMLAFSKEGLYDDVIRLMKQAGSQRVRISKRTLFTVLGDLENQGGRWKDCLKVIDIMRSLKDSPPCRKSYMIVLDCLRKGFADDSQKLTVQVTHLLQDICTEKTLSMDHKSLLCGYGLKFIPDGKACIGLLEIMRSAGVPLNDIHLGCALKALAENGLVDESLELLRIAKGLYGVELNNQHIGLSMLALSRRACQPAPPPRLWEEAIQLYGLVDKFGLYPSESILSCAIKTCAEGGAWPVGLLLHDQALLNQTLDPGSISRASFAVLDEEMLELFGAHLYKRANAAGAISCWKDRHGLLVDLHGHTTKMARVALQQVLKDVQPEEVMMKDLKIITGRRKRPKFTEKQHKLGRGINEGQVEGKDEEEPNLLSSFVRSFFEEKIKSVNRTGGMYNSSAGCLAIYRTAIGAILSSSSPSTKKYPSKEK